MPDDARSETVSFRLSPREKRRLERATDGSPSAILRRCAIALGDGSHPDEAVTNAMTDEIEAARQELAEAIETVRRHHTEAIEALDAVDDTLSERGERLAAGGEADDTPENRAEVVEILRRLDDHVDTGGRVIEDFRAVRDLADLLAVPTDEAHERYRSTRPTLPDAAFQEQRAGGKWDEVKAHIHEDTPATDDDVDDRAEKILAVKTGTEGGT